MPGGWGQVFQKGYAATTRTGGTHAVLGPVWSRYRLATGVLGPPVG